MNYKVSTKDIAAELMKAIMPKLNDMQKQIDDMDKRVVKFEKGLKILEQRQTTLSSIIINKRKHNK